MAPELIQVVFWLLVATVVDSAVVVVIGVFFVS